MSGQTISITLPDGLYERVKETAAAAALSVEEVLTQSVTLSLPALEDDLAPETRTNLVTLSLLSDPELWQIAEDMADDELQQQLEMLAERQKQRVLTEVEQRRLVKLMTRAQLFMLRKAEAYRLLARRGYVVFPTSTPTSN